MNFYAQKLRDKFILNKYPLKVDGEFVVSNGRLYEDTPPSETQIKEAYEKYKIEKFKALADLKVAKIKPKRDQLLVDSDWTQLPDSPLTEEKKNEWRVYRQALRDYPANLTPWFPTPPSNK